jgi:outer membrane protein assembly factor BamB
MKSDERLANFRIRRRSNLLVFGLFILDIFFFNSVAWTQTNSSANLAAAINFDKPLQLCYQNRADKISTAKTASDNEVGLFVAYQNGKIEKISLEKKLTAWISNLGGEIISDITFEHGKVYLITKISSANSAKEKNGEKSINDYFLWSINAETGITFWQFPFASGGSVHLNILETKLLLTSNNETIIAIRKFDGQKIFEKHIGLTLTAAPVFSDNKIYIPTDENTIVVITADTGEIISKIRTFQTPATIVAANAEKLYWGENAGKVNLVRLSDKSRVWSVRQGGEVASLDLITNGILISSFDNFIYLISLQKGKKIWKRRLAGRISVKPLITGNFGVFVTAVDNSVVILDLRDGKIVNQIPLGDKGFILSTPQIVHNLLTFPTTKGIFAFGEATLDCSLN